MEIAEHAKRRLRVFLVMRSNVKAIEYKSSSGPMDLGYLISCFDAEVCFV